MGRLDDVKSHVFYRKKNYETIQKWKKVSGIGMMMTVEEKT
jgi:hypothetical protein